MLTETVLGGWWMGQGVGPFTWQVPTIHLVTWVGMMIIYKFGILGERAHVPIGGGYQQPQLVTVISTAARPASELICTCFCLERGDQQGC